MRPQPEWRGDDLEAAANAAIAACDGNPHAALHALIVPNSFLIEQVDTLTKELDWAWHWIQSGLHRLDESAADEVGGRAALHRVRGWFGTAGGRGGLP